MRYVIGCDAALRLVAERVVLRDDVAIVAPALLRSQVLTALYEAVGRGELAKAEADARLDHLRALRIRLLGDRVLQRTAWQVAEQLGWAGTFDAEYVAVTRLQADALVTLDERLAAALAGVVPLASWDDLVAPTRA